jgi:benzoyl-CoA reductase/2-hydroxyglutaryl-CoA dehydratase subunit BcrC/BadD/HgdB
MIELLTMCGFETHELETELPRIERAFHRIGITTEDIGRGKERLARYYDIRLQGVRKAIGLSIREVVDTVLARDEGKKKILYGFMAGGFEILGSAVVTHSKDIHVSMLAPTFQFVLGCIFDKLIPVLEAAEQKWLKSGKVCHCANVKTLVGLLTLDIIPKPDLLVTSGQLCDTSPKTLDILHELYNIPIGYFDTCQDREFKDYPDSKRVISLSATSLRDLTHKVQEVVGFEITDDMLWDTINGRNEPRRIFRDVQNLMETSDPQPICATHETLLSFFSIPISTVSNSELCAILSTLCKELQKKVDRKEGVVPKGAPRILNLLPPNASDPRLDYLLCELGFASVVSETGHFPVHGNRYIDFNEDKPNDPYYAIASTLHRSLSQALCSRTAIISEICKNLHIDGVIGRYHVACRTTVGDPLLMKDVINASLGIPVTVLEWESFDPRVYNEEQLRRRLELFRDSMVENKQRN